MPTHESMIKRKCLVLLSWSELWFRLNLFIGVVHWSHTEWSSVCWQNEEREVLNVNHFSPLKNPLWCQFIGKQLQSLLHTNPADLILSLSKGTSEKSTIYSLCVKVKVEDRLYALINITHYICNTFRLQIFTLNLQWWHSNQPVFVPKAIFELETELCMWGTWGCVQLITHFKSNVSFEEKHYVFFEV